MKKKLIFPLVILILFIVIAFYGFRLYTKSFSPSAIAKFQTKALSIKVYYSRPSKKERKVFGGLVPFGKVWRTGANEATEFETQQNILFGGEKLKAGRYALFTIPEADHWTIILNKELGQWGAFTYNQSKDILRIEAPVYGKEKSTEKFTIQFQEKAKGTDMQFIWDQTKVQIPIEIPE